MKLNMVLPLLASTAILAGLSAPASAADTFQQALEKEYAKMAAAERGEYDWIDAEHFAEKSQQSASGTIVLPSNPNEWLEGYNIISGVRVPQSDITAASVARDRLLRVLDRGARVNKPNVAAVAQAQYDCWIEQAQEGWNSGDIATCKDAFFAALTDLEKPHPAVAYIPTEDRFSVYYSSGQTYNPSGTDSIAHQVANDVNVKGVGEVTVMSFADRQGDAATNLMLSQKRADAVVRALLGAGVPADKIRVVNYGESNPAVFTTDGISDPRNRRVTIRY